MPPRPRRQVNIRRVERKVSECSYFLGLMEEQRENSEQFSYCFSAFLASFVSIFYIARCVASNQGRTTPLDEMVNRLKESSPGLALLFDARDAEVHHEGASTVLLLGDDTEQQTDSGAPAFVFPSMKYRGRFESRFQPPFQTRFASRFESPIGARIFQPPAHYRSFQLVRNKRGELIAEWRNYLDALCSTVRTALL